MRSASLFLLVIALVSFLPRSAGALPTIIISEVAWMGTTLDGGKTSQAAQADEWIEFKNAGLAPVDLAGWVLRSATDDGGPVITLSGSIPAGGFFLLERTDDGAVPPPARHWNFGIIKVRSWTRHYGLITGPGTRQQSKPWSGERMALGRPALSLAARRKPKTASGIRHRLRHRNLHRIRRLHPPPPRKRTRLPRHRRTSPPVRR